MLINEYINQLINNQSTNQSIRRLALQIHIGELHAPTCSPCEVKLQASPVFLRDRCGYTSVRIAALVFAGHGFGGGPVYNNFSLIWQNCYNRTMYENMLAYDGNITEYCCHIWPCYSMAYCCQIWPYSGRLWPYINIFVLATVYQLIN